MTNPRFSLEDGDLSFVINHFSFVINFHGGRGIRTPGTVSRPTVFKTAALNHSAIPPLDRIAETFTRTLRPKTLRHASHGGNSTERFGSLNDEKSGEHDIPAVLCGAYRCCDFRT